MIKSLYPELNVLPHSSHVLDVSRKCPECLAANRRREEKTNEAERRRADKEAEKADLALSKVEREAGRIEHLFRPEQGTIVTLHDVHFVVTDPPAKFLKASFYGKVSDVQVDIVDGALSATITVDLIPRPDVAFVKVAQTVSPNGLSLSKNLKTGRCQVFLRAEQVTTDSTLVRLGRRNNTLADIEFVGNAVYRQPRTLS